MSVEPSVDTAPKVSDEIRKTTCYMCACRCGIDVHLRDGKIRYIEGNRNHPVNQGVLCAKGSAGIMQHYSPARPCWRIMLHDTGRTFGTQHPLIDWVIAIALDIPDLAIAQMHIDATAAGTHIAGRLANLVADLWRCIDAGFHTHTCSSWLAIAANTKDANRAAGGSDRLVRIIGTRPPNTTPAAMPPAK